MKKLLHHFWNDELGNTMIDWCILGAGATSLAVAVVTTLV